MRMITQHLVLVLLLLQNVYPLFYFPIQPSDLLKHHKTAVRLLQEDLTPFLFYSTKEDGGDTLVTTLFQSHLQSLNIWTGTWNMGECDPPYNIEEWIPNSFDVIAVGVQECMSIVFLFFPLELPDLEMRATGVIGSNYVSITEKVGSTRREVGFHGYIALIVVLVYHFYHQLFIRIDLLQSGFISFPSISTQTVALGANLVITRAGNKGGVCVRCPIDLTAWNSALSLQTHIDFICCHLAADQSGASKLEKRNEDAAQMKESDVMQISC